jgi:hypothetical protein
VAGHLEDRSSPLLTVTRLHKLSAAQEEAVEHEGTRLARFIAGPDAPVRVGIGE